MKIKVVPERMCTLDQMMIAYRGNQSEVARVLGMNRGTVRTLYAYHRFEYMVRVTADEYGVPVFSPINNFRKTRSDKREQE